MPCRLQLGFNKIALSRVPGTPCHGQDGKLFRAPDQCLWCRYSDDGELKWVIGIHVNDFLIGLADGILGEKWMSEIKSLYRWGSWKVSDSEFAGIRVRQYRDFSITVDLEDYTNKFITELLSHVNDQDNDKSL